MLFVRKYILAFISWVSYRTNHMSNGKIVTCKIVKKSER